MVAQAQLRGAERWYSCSWPRLWLRSIQHTCLPLPPLQSLSRSGKSTDVGGGSSSLARLYPIAGQGQGISTEMNDV